jgi:microsomal dipeptidase-like Zn-dependent dipeptidase
MDVLPHLSFRVRCSGEISMSSAVFSGAGRPRHLAVLAARSRRRLIGLKCQAGFENPREFPNVIRWLVAHGYTDEQIAKLVGGNILRALRDVWV